MRRMLCFAVFAGLFFTQCKDKDNPSPATGPVKEIDIIDFAVQGVDAKDVTVGENIIVIHLPEHYAAGDFIKPDIVLGSGYRIDSDLVNGFSYEGKRLSLTLESSTRQSRRYTICVVPYKAVELVEPVKDHQVVLGPEAVIAIPVNLKGTATTVNDSGKIVESPVMVLKDKVTGAIAYNIHPDAVYEDHTKKLKLAIPATVVPGDYVAELVWGAKREVFSNQLSVKSGPLRLTRSTWLMLPTSKYFEVPAYNISKTAKYEAVVQNDFIQSRRIPLSYKDAGTLSGNVPDDIATGNYKVTYWENGKIVEPYDDRVGPLRYMGDDQVYIRKYTDQPILRIVSQPSGARVITSGPVPGLGYYASLTEINRNEPLLLYIQRDGPFPNKNDLILEDIATGKAYTIPYAGDAYGIFDGFMMFLSYKIPNAVPAGKYAASFTTGPDHRSEKYGQILSIR